MKAARPPILRRIAWALLVAVTASVLAGSYVFGTLDDAMVRGGNAPIRRGLYWSFGAALVVALFALVVLVTVIGVQRLRQRR